MFSKLFFCLIFLTALTPLYSQEPLAQQLKSIIENKKATVGIAVLYNGKILVTVNDKAGSDDEYIQVSPGISRAGTSG